jgi:hypothetical protein|tara:strand:+ start:588 stop:1232 length:645 start_codon:yes stop_codon:yes gene_type:complete
MIKPNINIFEFDLLYQIFFEIKENLPFKITRLATNDIKDSNNHVNKNLKNSLIVSNFINKVSLIETKIINRKNLVFLSTDSKIPTDLFEEQIIICPIQINNLIEKLNVQLIKQKYDNQSHIKISNYILDLNSKIISTSANKLKLTERETEIILFLNDKKSPQKVNDLQNKVWGFSSDLETHTVETHIYRLRKKISNVFNDENFIISHKDGYLIK